MMELGAFPDKLRKQAIGIGQVLKMEMFPEDRVKPKQGKDSKPKRFVIIGQTDDGGVLAALLVNMRINESMFAQIAPYQHLVKVADNDYLDHDSYVDSYVDCYTVREFSSERVLKSAEYLGHIKEEDLKECLDHVRQSPAIKPYVLKKFKLEE